MNDKVTDITQARFSRLNRQRTELVPSVPVEPDITQLVCPACGTDRFTLWSNGLAHCVQCREACHPWPQESAPE